MFSLFKDHSSDWPEQKLRAQAYGTDFNRWCDLIQIMMKMKGCLLLLKRRGGGGWSRVLRTLSYDDSHHNRVCVCVVRGWLNCWGRQSAVAGNQGRMLWEGRLATVTLCNRILWDEREERKWWEDGARKNSNKRREEGKWKWMTLHLTVRGRDIERMESMPLMTMMWIWHEAPRISKDDDDHHGWKEVNVSEWDTRESSHHHWTMVLCLHPRPHKWWKGKWERKRQSVGIEHQNGVKSEEKEVGGIAHQSVVMIMRAESESQHQRPLSSCLMVIRKRGHHQNHYDHQIRSCVLCAGS